MNDELLDNDLIFQYPIIQKLGIIPAVLITSASDLAESPSLAKAPWDAVIITDGFQTEKRSYFEIPLRDFLEIENEGDESQDIAPSKKKLPVIIPPQNIPDDYWESDGANTLENIAGKIFQNGGVVFINKVDEKIYAEGLNSLTRRLKPCKSIYLIDCQGQKTEEWVDKGYATHMPAEAAKCIGEYYSEHSFQDEDAAHIYVSGELMPVKQEDSANISSFGQLLTSEELENEIFLSKKDFPYAFRQFLDRSVGGIPDWYCYNPEIGFHLKRHIEDTLTAKLNEALTKADSCNNANPVLLYGQAYSGKTNTLCALAYQIFSQHKYPVIFIPHTVDTNDAVVEKHTDSLNYLLRKIEDATKQNGYQVVPTLIVWDTSCRRKKDLECALNLLRKLRNQKRQVQLLFSAYEFPEFDESKYIPLKIDATLNTEEKKDLINILQEKGGFSRDETELCVKKFAKNPHFLASLYKFRELHQSMESHIRREVTAKNEDLENLLADITRQSLDKNLNNSLAILLESLDFGDSAASCPKDTEDTKNEIGNNLNNAISCVALCTFYGCSVPLSLFFRLLNGNSWDPVQFYTALSNHTLLREQGDDDDFELVIRSPLEAEFILRDTDRLEKLISIIDKIEVSNHKEIKLIRKLVQAMGPNCQFPNKTKYSLWESGWQRFPNVWTALAKLRKNATNNQQIRLLPQELSLMREYCHKSKDKNILKPAYELAQQAYKGITNIQDDLLKANIIVEYVELSRLRKENKHDLFQKMRQEMLKLAYGGNRHIQQTLLKLVLECYKERECNDPSSALNLLAEMHHWGAKFIGDADDELEKTITEIYGIIDTSTFDDTLINNLIEQKVTAAVYYKAIRKKRCIDTLPESKDKRKHKIQFAQNVLTLLNYDWINDDPKCLFLKIEMLWMAKTGLDIIPERELTCVGLQPEDWTEIQQLCESYCNLGERNPEITLLSNLAILHLGNANVNFGQVGKTTYSDGQWYLICDENGTPRDFSGIITHMYPSGADGFLTATACNNSIFSLARVHFRSYDFGNIKQKYAVINSFNISISNRQLEARGKGK